MLISVITVPETYIQIKPKYLCLRSLVMSVFPDYFRLRITCWVVCLKVKGALKLNTFNNIVINVIISSVILK